MTIPVYFVAALGSDRPNIEGPDVEGEDIDAVYQEGPDVEGPDTTRARQANEPDRAIPNLKGTAEGPSTEGPDVLTLEGPDVEGPDLAPATTRQELVTPARYEAQPSRRVLVTPQRTVEGPDIPGAVVEGDWQLYFGLTESDRIVAEGYGSRINSPHVRRYETREVTITVTVNPETGFLSTSPAIGFGKEGGKLVRVGSRYVKWADNAETLQWTSREGPNVQGPAVEGPDRTIPATYRNEPQPDRFIPAVYRTVTVPAIEGPDVEGGDVTRNRRAGEDDNNKIAGYKSHDEGADIEGADILTIEGPDVEGPRVQVSAGREGPDVEGPDIINPNWG